jgi:hypothetical protein
VVKVRLPPKIVLIVAGGVVLCGATGATAYFIGRDAILGPSEEELTGVTCTDVVRFADLRKGRGPWLRKYVKVPPGTDGITRAKTGIRVAMTLQKTLPADLIEIVVLDDKGPDTRAFMRGRAVGAEVILVKDPAGLPGVEGKYTVNYYEGAASGTGMFYGQAETMSSADAEALAGKMDELTDCAPAPGTADAKDEKKGHGEKPKSGHGEAKAEGGGHEGASGKAEGEGGGSGGHEAAAGAEGHGETAPTEEKSVSFVSKMMGMVGLGGSSEEATATEGHGAAPAEGHGGEAPAEGHGAAASAEGHGDAAPAAAHGEAAPADAGHEAKAEEPPKKGFMSKMLGIVGLGSAEKPATVIEHSGGPAIISAKAKPGEAPVEPSADAHGSAPATAHDAAAAQNAPAEASHDTAAHDTPAHETAPAEAAPHGAAPHDAAADPAHGTDAAAEGTAHKPAAQGAATSH